MKPDVSIISPREEVERMPRKRAKTGACMAWIKDNIDYAGEECLVWPFSRKADGRPSNLTINRKSYSTCRTICEMAHGQAPTYVYHVAAHSCGNAHLGCVNPRHLYWATHVENSADQTRHGTSPKGESNPRALLSEEDVLDICRMRGSKTNREIASIFGVSISLVNQIFRGAVWGHVTKDVLSIGEKLERHPLSKIEFAQVFLRQGGVCACGCKSKISVGDKIDDDHIIPLACGGTNDISNRQILLRDCHKRKTKSDIKSISRVRRLQGKTGQYKRRKSRGGSMIKGQGFDKRYTKKFSGKVIRREKE